MSSQFRRAAVSIAASIAEGFKKGGKAEKLRVLNITHDRARRPRGLALRLILAQDLDYGDVWS